LGEGCFLVEAQAAKPANCAKMHDSYHLKTRRIPNDSICARCYSRLFQMRPLIYEASQLPGHSCQFVAPKTSKLIPGGFYCIPLTCAILHTLTANPCKVVGCLVVSRSPINDVKKVSAVSIGLIHSHVTRAGRDPLAPRSAQCSGSLFADAWCVLGYQGCTLTDNPCKVVGYLWYLGALSTS
jgi:hypothetical protein